MAQERRWVGDQPVHEPPVRVWVVWGGGTRFPDAPFAYRAPNDIAEGIARTADPSWSPGWLALVDCDEQVVDEWASETGARYAQYLIVGETEEVGPPMR